MGLLGHVGATSFVRTLDFISDAKLSRKDNSEDSQTINQSAPDVIHDEDDGHRPRVDVAK